jgi:RNA polymerase sigma factor (sigma-70 family)
VVFRFMDDRHEAEEVAQEAFIRAWRGIGRFERDARFFTWLYRIAINEAHRRTARRPPAGLVPSLDERPVDPPDRGESLQRRAEHGDLREALERAIRALWQRCRFMREHRWTHAHLSDYLDGELHGDDRQRLETHVGLCPECRRVLAGLRRTIAALMGMRDDAHRDVAARIIARLRSEP